MTGKDDKQARLAEALRANLRRRKAQAREATAGNADEVEPKTGEDQASS